ncbi:uncharacterized protein LOC142223396 [Haematobia irritans]|uniref:uncharacterized protein LOC142223396 n=1 Tax=Haematobia irritans TaxID=7368 RepID=UPI003F4FCC8A
MNENDIEMKDAFTSSTTSTKEDDDDFEDDGGDESSSLWSIEDSMFFAQGLRNHSAGRGKSVFVTWNENYLLNFVFKTSSKTNKTTLTKVRLAMPKSPEDDETEEILDMLILEMNTLLLMKSGCVYYFSSVKSMHIVPWLNNIRCFCSCPKTQFSVIRFSEALEKGAKQLLLEVYRDIPQLGKIANVDDVIRHRYDISFDQQNIFDCNWSMENYILISLIVDKSNIDYLTQLISIGNIIRPVEEKTTIELNQELHIFAISGNLFVLIGAIISDNESSSSSDAEVQDYTIQLLNSYAATIECIKIDHEKNILIVLLQSGHMDIWYKSSHIFGSICHLSHEIPNFTHYDYSVGDNTFYFTKPDEITQLRIFVNRESADGKECTIKEVNKAIAGMIACTWVENLQQLICLSFNNIFYRLHFDSLSNTNENANIKDTNVEYENFNTLYTLNSKRMKDILGRAQIVRELMEQPKKLHERVEAEWQKQQLLALGSKKKIWNKILQCNLEYLLEPSMQCESDELTIRASFDNDRDCRDFSSVYTALYITIASKDNIFLSIIQMATWKLQLSVDGQSLFLTLPPASEIVNRRLCFLIKHSTRKRHLLPDFSVSLITFVQHSSVYLCISNTLNVLKSEKTYRRLFSLAPQIFLQGHNNSEIDNLLQDYNHPSNDMSARLKFPNTTIIEEKFHKISHQKMSHILKIFHKNYENNLNLEFKLYFLREHALHLNYDESQQQLVVKTHKPEALFYFKIFLLYEFKPLFDKPEDNKEILQKIMQYQANVENGYGSTSLTSTDHVNNDSGTVSLHLENLLKIYTKLRSEFNEFFR